MMMMMSTIAIKVSSTVYEVVFDSFIFINYGSSIKTDRIYSILPIFVVTELSVKTLRLRLL
jgi:hypothetical protein